MCGYYFHLRKFLFKLERHILRWSRLKGDVDGKSVQTRHYDDIGTVPTQF